MHIKVNFGSSDTLINAKLSPSDMTLDVELTSANQQIPVSFCENTGIGEDTLAMRINDTLITYTNKSAISIPSYCFSRCNSLKSVDMPNVQYIGEYAFYITGVEKLAFPKLASVSDNTFYYTSSLTIFDTSASSIGRNAFYNDTFFKTLILRHNAVVEIEYATFAQTGFLKSLGGGVVYVPNSLLETYQNEAWLEIRERLIDVTFQPIEGSPYELYYADGTPVE